MGTLTCAAAEINSGTVLDSTLENGPGATQETATLPKRRLPMPGLFPAPPNNPRIKPVRSTALLTDRLPNGAPDNEGITILPLAESNERTNEPISD